MLKEVVATHIHITVTVIIIVRSNKYAMRHKGLEQHNVARAILYTHFTINLFHPFAKCSISSIHFWLDNTPNTILLAASDTE